MGIKERLGETTADHLGAWIRSQFIEEWEQDEASSKILAYLDRLDDEDYAYALEQGWVRVWEGVRVAEGSL